MYYTMQNPVYSRMCYHYDCTLLYTQINTSLPVSCATTLGKARRWSKSSSFSITWSVISNEERREKLVRSFSSMRLVHVVPAISWDLSHLQFLPYMSSFSLFSVISSTPTFIAAVNSKQAKTHCKQFLNRPTGIDRQEDSFNSL